MVSEEGKSPPKCVGCRQEGISTDGSSLPKKTYACKNSSAIIKRRCHQESIAFCYVSHIKLEELCYHDLCTLPFIFYLYKMKAQLVLTIVLEIAACFLKLLSCTVCVQFIIKLYSSFNQLVYRFYTILAICIDLC